VFQKSDAKIEIAITATNLIRIKYPHSIFNYHPSAANVANFNKIHCTVFEQQLFKNGTQKQKFLIWKSCLSSSYAIPSVTVCAESGRHLHSHLHVSCAHRIFSAAAGLPAVSADPVVSICRRSRSSAEQDLNSPWQEISPTTFWHCNPYSVLKL